MSTSLRSRVEIAAKYLGHSPEVVLKALKENGIDDDGIGIAILESETTTEESICNIFYKIEPKAPSLRVKAAAFQLKKSEKQAPKVQDFPAASPPVAQPNIADILKSIRPIAQWNDRELLVEYVKTKDSEIENELHKRAKNGPFVVLKTGKYEPGKEEVDLEFTLELLKEARKRVNPTYLPNGNVFSNVFKITELNPSDRIVELCPFCGNVLYKGFCQECETLFTYIGEDEKAYLRLISDYGKFQAESLSDRNAAVTSARKGLEDLKVTWPSLAQKFEDLKLTNNLPRLKIIENRPPTTQSVQDPFYKNGHRTF